MPAALLPAFAASAILLVIAGASKIASPYMAGGETKGIPATRRLLSKGANWFLSKTAQGHLSTVTGLDPG